MLLELQTKKEHNVDILNLYQALLLCQKDENSSFTQQLRLRLTFLDELAKQEKLAQAPFKRLLLSLYGVELSHDSLLVETTFDKLITSFCEMDSFENIDFIAGLSKMYAIYP